VEEKTECAAYLKNLVSIFVDEIYEMRSSGGNSTCVLYIGWPVLNVN
jgi:hypothetical protein